MTLKGKKYFGSRVDDGDLLEDQEWKKEKRASWCKLQHPGDHGGPFNVDQVEGAHVFVFFLLRVT